MKSRKSKSNSSKPRATRQEKNRCSVCGYHIWGKHHEEGSHHKLATGKK